MLSKGVNCFIIYGKKYKNVVDLKLDVKCCIMVMVMLENKIMLCSVNDIYF